MADENVDTPRRSERLRDNVHDGSELNPPTSSDMLEKTLLAAANQESVSSSNRPPYRMSEHSYAASRASHAGCVSRVAFKILEKRVAYQKKELQIKDEMLKRSAEMVAILQRQLSASEKHAAEMERLCCELSEELSHSSTTQPKRNAVVVEEKEQRETAASAAAAVAAATTAVVTDVATLDVSASLYANVAAQATWVTPHAMPSEKIDVIDPSDAILGKFLPEPVQRHSSNSRVASMHSALDATLRSSPTVTAIDCEVINALGGKNKTEKGRRNLFRRSSKRRPSVTGRRRRTKTNVSSPTGRHTTTDRPVVVGNRTAAACTASTEMLRTRGANRSSSRPLKREDWKAENGANANYKWRRKA